MKDIYSFEEGGGKGKKLLGGKGAGLCEMTRLKLPVPPGFIITTQVCDVYYKNGRKLPNGLISKVKKHIARMEKKTSKKWGSKKNPLLVSVRSGAAVSMPGMMDTILNLGLNDETVQGLASKSQNPRFAWDSYRRFVQLFGKVVFGIDDKHFDDILEAKKREAGAKNDSDLDVDSLVEVTRRFQDVCKREQGRPFPSDPTEQLELAITAVFDSWMGERAVVYRLKNGITGDVASGTAVNIVAMIFGNMGSDSATGVVFTRNPGDGTRQIYGDYLQNAQGEDVVAGVRTGKHMHQMREEMPDSYRQVEKVCKLLEKHYREPQDIEFTIEQGRFYLLQTRNAKMNAASMIKTSIDMVNERMIGKDHALMRLHAEQLEQLLHDMPDPEKVGDYEKLAQGIAASPGAASGAAVFDVKRAVAMGKEGAQVILVREETKPEDVPAFFESAGILTSRGGKASHAAVVTRGMGKPCIVGCTDLKMDYSAAQCTTADGTIIKEGDIITIDGSSGRVYAGSIPTIKPEITQDFKRILGWANKAKRLGIRANADTPEAAALARRYGAEGIGLCRTERMFNDDDRIGLFVKMIMAKDAEERKALLEDLGRLQKADFVRIFDAMRGYKVTIRLLDPPLHEFLPNPEEQAAKVRELEGASAKDSRRKLAEARTVLERARELAEVNPMMGHRGVRVGVTYPEIYRMQMRAVFEALAEIASKGTRVYPQIMVPQVSSVSELNHIKSIYDDVKKEVEGRYGKRLQVSFGTMIEVVRAALTADHLAETAEFFSYGTNDLTQGTFSFSREDVEGKFIPEYMDKGLIDQNPFQSIDRDGVGSLMRIGMGLGRGRRKDLEVGICGEHGGDPSSVKFCHGEGLSYVSASPYRIPIAIVAAAQAAIAQKQKTKK